MTLMLDDKKKIVDEVLAVASKALGVVAADYRGLTVVQMTKLRAAARKSGVYLRVVRNTLARRAVKDTEFACIADALTGPLVLAFAKDEPGAAARLFRDFCKDFEKLEVKVVALAGKLFDASQLDVIAKLPTRDEALSQLLAVMKEPVTKLARLLGAPQTKLVRTLVAVRDQKQAA